MSTALQGQAGRTSIKRSGFPRHAQNPHGLAEQCRENTRIIQTSE